MSSRHRTILDGLRVLAEHERQAQTAAWERVIAAQERYNAALAASEAALAALPHCVRQVDKTAALEESEKLSAVLELALSAKGAAVDALMTAVQAREAAITAVLALKEEIATPPPTAAAAGAGVPAAAADNQLAAGAGDAAGPDTSVRTLRTHVPIYRLHRQTASRTHVVTA
jgi:hypothetical protein